jgi:hypothetical protein
MDMAKLLKLLICDDESHNTAIMSMYRPYASKKLGFTRLPFVTIDTDFNLKLLLAVFSQFSNKFRIEEWLSACELKLSHSGLFKK